MSLFSGGSIEIVKWETRRRKDKKERERKDRNETKG